MFAARLATLRPALRTLSSKPKEVVDPTTTSAWWKDWAGQNHQGFFNVGAAFFLTVLASQNYSGPLQPAAVVLRREIGRILDPPLVLPGPSETSPALV